MARRTPRQSRSRALVEAILEGALQVIGKSRAFGDVTTKTVAKRAGVSIGSLYQYFSNKDVLFTSLIERELRRQAERFRALIDESHGESVDVLIKNFVAEADALCDRSPALTTLFVEAMRLGSIGAVGETRTEIAQMLAAALRERGEYIEPLEERLELLIHAVMGVYEARALRPGTLAGLALEGEVDALCRGYLSSLDV
jgi:AcrR family transcriptional regulator